MSSICGVAVNQQQGGSVGLVFFCEPEKQNTRLSQQINTHVYTLLSTMKAGIPK